MNSTTTSVNGTVNGPANGTEVFVPFWVVLDCLDATPPEPFVRCTVLNSGRRRLASPSGPVTLDVCDLELKPGLVAAGIPAEYLVQRTDLDKWAKCIAAWFAAYPGKVLVT